MTLPKTSILVSLLAWVLIAVSCGHSVVTKLTPSNYEQITTGMTKAQVERILGPPTTVETKDMMIFRKTTYRYEDGKKFAMFTFKNDELDGKEGSPARTVMVDFSTRHHCCFERKNGISTFLNRADALVFFHPGVASDLQTEPSIYEGAWTVCCF